MPDSVGTWLYSTSASAGESVKVLRLELLEGGQTWGQKAGIGWTPTLQCRTPGTNTVVDTISGSWESGASAACLFAVGSEATLVPTGRSATYEGMLVMTRSGSVAFNPVDDEAKACGFTITRWP